MPVPSKAGLMRPAAPDGGGRHQQGAREVRPEPNQRNRLSLKALYLVFIVGCY
jgi:hypothetical protein